MPTINADGTCVCGIAASDCDYHRPTATLEKLYGLTVRSAEGTLQAVTFVNGFWLIPPGARVAYHQLYCSPPKYNATVTL